MKKIFESFSRKKQFVASQPSDPLVSLWAEDVKIFKERLSFKITDGKDSIPLRLPLVGKENIINILLASLVAKNLGMSLNQIQKCFQSCDFSCFEKIQHRSGIDIINATYSTNPNSFTTHLEHLKLWSGKKIVVTPGIIELGTAASRLHQEIGEKLATTADLIILTKDYYLKDIQEGINRVNQTKKVKAQFYYLSNSSAVVQKIKHYAQQGDVILLEGRLPRAIINNL